MIELILIIIITILLIFLLKDYFKEKYTSKKEKANVIYEWFTRNPDPRYTRYQRDVSDSDIVEYLDVKQKGKNQKITQDDVYNLLY